MKTIEQDCGKCGMQLKQDSSLRQANIAWCARCDMTELVVKQPSQKLWELPLEEYLKRGIK